MITIKPEPVWLKCNKCGKMHLYDSYERIRDTYIQNVECPSCGNILDESNIIEKFN